MDFRGEKLATWVDPSIARSQGLRVLKGSIPLDPKDLDKRMRIAEDRIHIDQIEDQLLKTNGNTLSDIDDPSHFWHFKAISFPRLRSDYFAISIPKQVFRQIQVAWNLHPRTIDVFLSNNGLFTTFRSATSERTSFLLKVANSVSIGYDCVSVTCDPSRRTTYALYHHLEDEASLFATLLSTPEQCIDPHFFVATLYRSHHQHIENHRNTIDGAVVGIERQTGFGSAGALMTLEPHVSPHTDASLAGSKDMIQQLSYCQTDLAIIGHVARFDLEWGEWLLMAIDESLLGEHHPDYGQKWQNGSDSPRRNQNSSESPRAARLMIRQDVEYIRRRTVTLLSQVQQLRDRVQSQTTLIFNTIAQSDTKYTAAIAVDGKRDSIAMKTIAILGIVFLPGTFVATLFSIDMFDWGVDGSGESTSLTVSRSLWIYWAITVPLTALTFLVWIIWSRREIQKSSKRLMIDRTKPSIAESRIAAVTSSPGLAPDEKMV